MSAPGPRRTGWAAALVALAAFAAYAQTLGHGFVFDDGPEVVDNLFLRSLADLPRLLTTASWEGTGEGSPPQYRPLTSLLFALNYAAGGLSPWGYHLVNVLLHALASALVLLVALQLGLPLAGAAAAGLAFALHPVHVEAVANVAGRKDVLVTALCLAALLAHAAALRRAAAAGSPARRGPAAWAAVLCFAGALASKENGLVLVGLLAARDLLFGRAEWSAARRTALGLYAAYAAAIALYLLARWHAVGSLVFPVIGFEENPLASAPAATRILSAVAVLGRGLALFAWPAGLSPDYSYDAIPAASGPADLRFLGAFAAIAALGVLAWRGRARWPLGAFAFAWWAMAVFPTSNLLVRVGTIFGERLLYLPSVAFCLAAGGAAALLWETRAATVAWTVVPAALLACAAQTVRQAAVWVDEPVLFAAAARAQPESSRAWRLHGGALMEQGRPEEAAQAFEQALRILSRGPVPPEVRARPRLELGVALEGLGRLPEAEQLYAAVLQERPAHAEALWRLGVVRWRQGRRPDAVALWQRAVAAEPRHARALSDLGIAALAAGDSAGAKAFWRRAAEADPTVASVWYRLGNLHEREGDLPAARVAWTEFLRRAHDRHPQWRAEVAQKLGTSATPR